MDTQELNERVAAEVMGYTHDGFRWSRQEQRHSDELGDYKYTDILYGGLPNYSGDIAAAWLVVEEMPRRGVRLASLGQYEDMETWCAIFAIRNPLLTVGVGDGNTAPSAICRAALDIYKKLNVSDNC